MAKQRIINTRFWDDNYISNLDPIEKLLFLYILTNTSTNICGIYEIPLKKIANETGIDKEMVIKIIERFTRDEKIFYFKGWVCIKNFIKHQNQRSPQVKKGIENEIMAIPKDILNNMIGYGYGIDTLSYLNLNLNSNLNLNVEKVSKNDTGLINEIIYLMEEVDPKNKTYYKNKTQRECVKFLIDNYGFEKVKEIISVLPETNKLDFVPTITSPYDLKEKWSKLIIQVGKLQNNKKVFI